MVTRSVGVRNAPSLPSTSPTPSGVPSRLADFITGSGGYVQSFVFGYSGLRVDRLGVFSFASQVRCPVFLPSPDDRYMALPTAQAPVLPPNNVTGVCLRALHLLGAAFDFSYDAETACARAYAASPPPAPLELRVAATGQRLPLTAGGAAVCVPLQAVSVAGVGYE